MTAAHRRHAISDKVWGLLEPHLPGRPGAWGGKAQDNRRFINAVFWILRTGAPWRDLPPDSGDGKHTHRRFCRWREAGRGEALREKRVDDPDFEWLMIDASDLKVHPHGVGAPGGNQAMSRTKGGSTRNDIWPWRRRVCRSECLLRRVPQRIVPRRVSSSRESPPSSCWQTGAMRVTRLLNRPKPKARCRLSHPERTGGSQENTTPSSTGYAIG